jgi:hypothetical protein
MGSIKQSFFLPSAVIGTIIGFLLVYFNVFNLLANIWIPIAIVCALGAIGIFIGKIIELEWVDAGLPLGALIGGAIAYLIF